MSEPHPEPPAPSVSTAPPEAPAGRRRRVPSHLGPARTSTVLLVVAFLAIGLLYLFVRPEPTGVTPTGPETSGEQPAGPATTAPTTAPEPSPTTEPEPTPTPTPTPTEPTDTTPPTDGSGTTPPDDGTTPTSPSGTPGPTAPDGTGGGEATGVPDDTPTAPPS